MVNRTRAFLKECTYDVTIWHTSTTPSHLMDIQWLFYLCILRLWRNWFQKMYIYGPITNYMRRVFRCIFIYEQSNKVIFTSNFPTSLLIGHWYYLEPTIAVVYLIDRNGLNETCQAIKRAEICAENGFKEHLYLFDASVLQTIIRTSLFFI